MCSLTQINLLNIFYFKVIKILEMKNFFHMSKHLKCYSQFRTKFSKQGSLFLSLNR